MMPSDMFSNQSGVIALKLGFSGGSSVYMLEGLSSPHAS